MPSVTYLCRLTAADIPALEKIEGETGLAFWGKDNYCKFLEEYPEYFGYKVVITDAKERETTAGFYLARALFENLEILKIGVSLQYQRQGIGRRLMESAYAEGIRRGCKRCFLEVRKSNQTAIQFYYGQRFKVAGTRLNYYSNPVEDAWIMERAL